MIRKLLVPLDGSDVAERIFSHVIALARPLGAAVHLLRVLKPSNDHGEDTVAWELRRIRAEVYLQGVSERLGAADLRVTWAVHEGHVPSEIFGSARRESADLVMLGTHGRSGLTEFALGSTALQLLSRPPSSVLMVPTLGPDPGRLLGATGVRRLLVPVDGSSQSAWAVAVARRIAAIDGSVLTLVHVAPEPEFPHLHVPLAPEEIRLQRQVTERNLQAASVHLAELQAACAKEDVVADYRLECDPNPARRLTEVIADEAPDLVVLCAHGGGARQSHAVSPFGAVAGYLLAHAVRPTLVLQDRADTDPTRPAGTGAYVALPRRAATDSSTKTQ